MAAPTGITATGVIIHEVRETEEDMGFEYLDAAGAFEGGKSLRKKKTFGVRGICESTAALPDVGSGDGVTDTPHIDSTEIVDKNEGPADFSIAAHEYAAGEGDWSVMPVAGVS
jgi:hypothetical protein